MKYWLYKAGININFLKLYIINIIIANAIQEKFSFDLFNKLKFAFNILAFNGQPVPVRAEFDIDKNQTPRCGFSGKKCYERQIGQLWYAWRYPGS